MKINGTERCFFFPLELALMQEKCRVLLILVLMIYDKMNCCFRSIPDYWKHQTSSDTGSVNSESHRVNVVWFYSDLNVLDLYKLHYDLCIFL